MSSSSPFPTLPSGPCPPTSSRSSNPAPCYLPSTPPPTPGCSTGHTEFIVVADAGLPIPKAVERIDLALRPGVPSFLDVLDTVLDEFVVERAVVAREMVEQSPDMLAALRQRLDAVGVDVEFVGHSELKQETHRARAVVRSGEFTPFANVLLYAGVPF